MKCNSKYKRYDALLISKCEKLKMMNINYKIYIKPNEVKHLSN
jgi:hypothetical protein